MNNQKLLLTLIFLVLSLGSYAEELYREKYRPQYHFTPAHRWIGDPCGTIKYRGKYIAYSWGAAESSDLIHWSELNNHAIKSVPEGIATFTGSVVADSVNSAGYGKDALIAVYTSFDEQTKKQSQSIAFSRDGGVTFQDYEQNPVLDIWSTEFRDPTVIRDAENERWVMLVAKALEKKVSFYCSSDLKHWKWMSDFGPLGDSERSWECPDMIQIPVEGTDNKKWVLIVSVNWAREQYFVGDFDGEFFVADEAERYPLYIDDGLDYYASRVFQDYDTPETDEVYTIGWVNTWDYATAAPSEWGKGVWSLPRRLSLYETPSGLKLRQRPVETISSLRGEPLKFNRRLKPGRTVISGIEKLGNVYEMKLRLDNREDDVVGLNLCEGDGRRVTLSFDTASRYLILDRTNCSDVEIPKFDRLSYLKVPGDTLDLDIFVDKSTVEVFVNGGERVLTLLTYAGDTQTSASLTSTTGKSTINLTTYPISPATPLDSNKIVRKVI